jgi:hypothetical protein
VSNFDRTFWKKVLSIISKGSTIDSLIEKIDKDFFLFGKHFRRFMKRKLDIYWPDKIQDKAHNHCTKSHNDTDIVNLEF